MTATRHRLSDLIEVWARSQKSQGLALNTIKARDQHLRALMAVVGNIQVASVERRHVDTYFEHQMTKARPLSPLSLNKHKESLDVFFGWAVQNRYLPADCNPMAGRRKFKAVPKQRLLIPASDFPHLLDCAPHPRDRIVVALGLYLFPRQSEIRSLRIKDVDLERGYVYMQNHKSATADDMPICIELDREIRRWLVFYAEQFCLDPGHFFVPAKPTIFAKGLPGRGRDMQLTATLNPIKPMGEIHDAAQRTLTAAGYAIRSEDGESAYEGVHTLRRSGARALYDRLLERGHDGAIRAVQSMLHHSSVVQTERYLGMQLDRARRDKLIKGQFMFGDPTENVVQLVREA